MKTLREVFGHGFDEQTLLDLLSVYIGMILAAAFILLVDERARELAWRSLPPF
jgi:hypothetical protein